MARPYFLRPLTGALLGFVLSLFILSSRAVADPPATTYSFTTFAVPGATGTLPTSINDSGQVTGNSSAGSHGFLYSGGTVTTLDVPGAAYTYATSINASGQVTGSYSDGSHEHGFVYSGGTFTTFAVPGATFTFARSINASGQVAGFYYDGSGGHNGFVYSNSAFTTFDAPVAPPNNDGTIPHTSINDTSINDSGQVAGSYIVWNALQESHGFLYSGGTVATLDVPGAIGTSPTSINASGQITGSYVDSSGRHGFVYSGGTFTTLDVPGAGGTVAASINASGQVTGSYSAGGFIATPMSAPTDIPTLSQWALLLGGGLLIGMALLAQVRRTRPLRG